MSATCSTSNLVPWNAELAIRVPRSSEIGWTPLFSASLFFSITKAAAPIPKISPLRRLSNGKAVSSTTFPVAAAPEAAKPLPIHSHRESPVTSSPEITITRSQRSFANQSSATPNAAVVEAQARLIVVFGPRIPTCCAN